MLVNNQLFLINEKDIPTSPIEFSEDAKQWWTQQKKYCIEGLSIGGKWMSPNLYFYVNFWKILLNKGKSKTKTVARPYLRDIEWEIFTAWALARGLSGFDNLELKGETTEDKMNFLWNLPSSDFNYPLYNNDAKDLMLMGPREFGKSYIVAGGLIGHEWIFNGAKRYLSPNDPLYSPLTTNIVVGAGDTKYSNDLLAKFKLGYDSLAQQGIEFGSKFYPHPFTQTYDGSLLPGKSIVAQYKKKVGGTWRYEGTKSAIKHVAYKNNVFAAQGSRNSVMVKEEIGMFEHLEATKEADRETMMSGTSKYGSCAYVGTGGSMDKGTLGAYKMYYDPEIHDILPFIDRWENKGKIGMFVPATHRANEHKDSEGNTLEELAKSHYLKERDRIKRGKNAKSALNNYIQYNPLVPSEVFLRSVGNFFPVADLLFRLAELETKTLYRDAEDVGDFIINEEGIIQFHKNPNIQAIYDFPLKSNDDAEGAVVIYEHPKDNEEGLIDYNRYIAGIDPYDHDHSTTTSLGSTIVLDRLTNRIVAEYTARTDTSEKYYEVARRLLEYYNAKAMVENQNKGILTYFKNQLCDYLLAPVPKIMSDVIQETNVDRTYGVHMTKEIKAFGEQLINSWLLEPLGEKDLRTLHKIRCIPLLKELIIYDPDLNTDRVMAMMMVLYYRKELQERKADNFIKIKRIEDSDFFNKPLFSRRQQWSTPF